MTLKMSKNDKALFYYLGLTLLVLIVLGAVFGISSVKESFGRKNRWNRWKRRNNRWKMTRCCIKARAAGDPRNTRKEWCVNDIKNGGVYPKSRSCR